MRSHRRAGMLVSALALLVGSALCPSVARADGFTDEVELDTPVPSAAGDQGKPKIAYGVLNGVEVYLAVFVAKVSNSQTNIMGVRMKRDGTAIDTFPFPIAALGVHDDPSVSWANDSFLVAWTDRRNASQSTGYDENIYGTRVMIDGTVETPDGFPISNVQGRQNTPIIAGGPQGWLVAWSDERYPPMNPGNYNYDAYVARITPTGTVVDPNGIKLADTPETSQMPGGIAWFGSNWLVSWTDTATGSNDVRATTVAIDGQVGTPNGFAVASSASAEYANDIVVHGDRALMLYTKFAPNDAEIYASRMDVGGFLYDAGNGIQVTHAVGYDINAVGVPTPSGVRLGWLHSEGTTVYDTYTMMIDDDVGAITGEGPFEGGPEHSLRVSMATAPVSSSAEAGAIGWAIGLDSHQGDVIGQTSSIDIQNSMSQPVTLGAVANRQNFAAIAANGTGYYAVWFDARDGGYGLYGGRLDGTGALVGTAMAITNSALTENDHPAVVWAGDRWIVAWGTGDYSHGVIRGAVIDESGAFATGFSEDGVVLVDAMNGRNEVTLASSGHEVLLAWDDGRASTNQVWTKLLNTDLSVTTTDGTALTVMAQSTFSPQAVYDASTNQYIVVWRDSRNSVVELRAARFATDGTTTDGEGVTLVSPIGDYVSIGANGTGLYLTWSDGRNYATSTYDLYGSRMSPDLTLLDAPTAPPGIPIAQGAQASQYPVVVWDGGQWIAAWFEGPQSFSATTGDILLSRISADGVVLDPDGVAVSSTPNKSEYPTIASLGQGRTVALYDRVVPDMGASRIFSRSYAAALAGLGCDDNAACTSGFCVDGVCCDTACGGDVTTDCQACSVAAGAMQDGTCGTVHSAVVCRPAASTCDVAEACDGSATVCPTDVLVDDGTTCNGTGTCESGVCEGGSTGGSAGSAGTSGAAGTAGSSGSAGHAGATGNAGNSGNSGNGGTSGTSAAGTAGTAAGTSGTSGTAGSAAAASDDSGCGCRTTGAPDHNRPMANASALAVLGAVITRLRRKNRIARALRVRTQTAQRTAASRPRGVGASGRRGDGE